MTVIRRNEKTPNWDGRGIPPSGGDITPAEFWARPDPEAARMKKKTRLPMGRPLT